MPTKILVLETPNFQIGANAGEQAERMAPELFPARLQKHFETGGDDMLFVLAPQEVRHQGVFQEAVSGKGSVSVAFFASTQDAVRFLPSLLIFAGEKRAEGVKNALKTGSTIYSESFFGAKAVGTRLDPCFNFARAHVTSLTATNVWGCLQSLVFLGLQNLPEQGEKGTGEKVDAQLGSDDKYLAFTVRFDINPAHFNIVRSNPMLMLPKSCAGVVETRYIQSASKVEFNCLFSRNPGITDRTIEISSYHKDAALEKPEAVKDYVFKSFGSLGGETVAEKKVAKGGFKKKFSEQVALVSPDASTPEATTKVSGGATLGASATKVGSGNGSGANVDTTTISAGTGLPPDATTVVGGEQKIVFDRETVFKNENAANENIQLKSRVIELESILKVREETIAKYTKDANDPLAKRDVLTNIKDSQSEGLKSTIKLLENEVEEAKKREKELMKMVDKAVQMKDEAAKKIKELDLKLKQASGSGGSKVQMLEKEIEVLKAKNKELAARAAAAEKRKAA